MAYDEQLAERVRGALEGRGRVEEKRMFGGLTFMLEGHMCCGVVREELMVRVGEEREDEALARPGARPMDFTRRPMPGFVFVAAEGLADDQSLRGWVELAAAHNATLPPRG